MRPERHASRCSTAERDALTLDNLGLIGRVINRMRHADIDTLGGEEDAFQLGVIALMRAAELYDPERISTARNPGKRARFSTYATRSIINCLRNAIAESATIRLPRYEWVRRRKVQEPLPVVKQWARIRPTHDYAGTDGMFGSERATVQPLAPAEPDPYAHEELYAAMSHLTPAERELLHQRYWQGMILRDIAAAAGVSHQATRDRVLRAVAKLRKILVARAAA